MPPKHFVEDAFILDIRVIKKELKKLREGEEINGIAIISNESKKIQMNYWSLDKNGEKFLVVNLIGTEPQEIALQLFPLKYGTASFYTCPSCFKRCSKLYVRSDKFTGFQCVKCNKLIYKLSSINRHSDLSYAEYRMVQYEKFWNIKTPHIFYNGKLTKPFLRQIEKMKKLGMWKKVKEGLSDIEQYKKISQKVLAIQQYFDN